MSIHDFFGAWEIFRAPTLAGVYAGVMLGMLGVFVVLRRMVFLSAALSQVASFGVVVSFLLVAAIPSLAGTSVTAWCTTAVTFVVLLAIVHTRRREDSSAEVLLGVAFLVGAGGTLALGSRVVEELHDVDTLLLGTAVAVVPEDTRTLGVLMFVTVLLLLWGSRGFFGVSFDRDHSAIRGLPVAILDLVLLSMIAAALSTATSILGALPTFAFSVLPAVAASALCRTPHQTLVVAGLIGGFSGFLGYLTAFLWNLPVGSSYALVSAGFAASMWLVSALGRLTGWRY